MYLIIPISWVELSMAETSIPVNRDTLRRVRRRKRGGESYDELLLKMCDSYEPAPASVREPPLANE